MKKLIVPKFNTDSEEAKWWDDHMDVVEGNLLEAIENGTTHKGGPGRVLQERQESKDITIRVAIADIQRAREQAEKKGLSYNTYIEMLLHEALEQQETSSRL